MNTQRPEWNDANNALAGQGRLDGHAVLPAPLPGVPARPARRRLEAAHLHRSPSDVRYWLFDQTAASRRAMTTQASRRRPRTRRPAAPAVMDAARARPFVRLRRHRSTDEAVCRRPTYGGRRLACRPLCSTPLEESASTGHDPHEPARGRPVPLLQPHAFPIPTERACAGRPPATRCSRARSPCSARACSNRRPPTSARRALRQRRLRRGPDLRQLPAVSRPRAAKVPRAQRISGSEAPAKAFAPCSRACWPMATKRILSRATSTVGLRFHPSRSHGTSEFQLRRSLARILGADGRGLVTGRGGTRDSYEDVFRHHSLHRTLG